MTKLDEWKKFGDEMGWKMPPASSWFNRLPVIRHFRAVVLSFQVHAHNQFWLSAGFVPNGYDDWVLYGIWRGQEGH